MVARHRASFGKLKCLATSDFYNAGAYQTCQNVPSPPPPPSPSPSPVPPSVLPSPKYWLLAVRRQGDTEYWYVEHRRRGRRRDRRKIWTFDTNGALYNALPAHASNVHSFLRSPSTCASFVGAPHVHILIVSVYLFPNFS